MKTFVSFSLATLVLLCIGWVTVVPNSSSSGGVSVAAGTNIVCTTNGTVVTVSSTASGGGTPAVADLGNVTGLIAWSGANHTNVIKMTLTGNANLDLGTSLVAGWLYCFEVVENGTGGYYLSATNTAIRFSRERTPITTIVGVCTNAFNISTNANSTNMIWLQCGYAGASLTFNNIASGITNAP